MKHSAILIAGITSILLTASAAAAEISTGLGFKGSANGGVY
jgi:hypothetical protein